MLGLGLLSVVMVIFVTVSHQTASVMSTATFSLTAVRTSVTSARLVRIEHLKHYWDIFFINVVSNMLKICWK